MKDLGWKIGDECYSTTSFTGKNGKSIVPGSRGTVTGPCNSSSAADADQVVNVKFDSGVVVNMLAKPQIKTAARWAELLAQVRTAQLQPQTALGRATASERSSLRCTHAVTATLCIHAATSTDQRPAVTQG